MRTALAATLAIVAPALADPPARTYTVVDTCPGSQDSASVALAAGPRGDTFAATTFITASGLRAAVFCHTRDGSTRWARTDLADTAPRLGGLRAATAPDGSLYIVATATAPGETAAHWQALRLNPDDGSTLWSRRVSTLHAAAPPAQVVATPSRLHIAGMADNQWAAASLNADSGDTLWTAQEPAPDPHCGRVSYATSAAADDDGSLYVSGLLQVDHDSNCDEILAPAVARYDAAGNRRWLTLLPSSGTVDPLSQSLIRVRPDGAPIAFASQNTEVITYLLDPADGSPVWGNRWNQASGAILRDAAIAADGSAFLAADIQLAKYRPEFTFVRRLDPAGQPVWTTMHRAPEDAQVDSFALALAPTGEVFIAAHRFASLRGGALAFALRATDGVELWSDVSPAPGEPYWAVVTDASGSPTFAATAGSSILLTRYGCLADFNGDGFLDFFDDDAFVLCFEGGECPPGRDADFNNDGFADFFDHDAFVAAFESGC